MTADIRERHQDDSYGACTRCIHRVEGVGDDEVVIRESWPCDFELMARELDRAVATAGEWSMAAAIETERADKAEAAFADLLQTGGTLIDKAEADAAALAEALAEALGQMLGALDPKTPGNTFRISPAEDVLAAHEELVKP